MSVGTRKSVVFLAAIWLAILSVSGSAMASGPVPILIDADTANEMDDMYAIAQAVLDPALDVTAIVSAHFNNYDIVSKGRWHDYDMEGFVPVDASHRENVRLVEALGVDIPTLMGADDIIGHSWGYYDGAPVPGSPGIDHIVAAARGATPDEPLNIVVLGPLTDVAAALIRAPDIAPNIHVYALGMRYDPDSRVWNKNEFNARNDLNAVDYLLDRNDVALTVMPANISQALTFDREGAQARLAALNTPLSAMLGARWDSVGAGDSWVMWDLALTLAIAHPDLATVERRAPPPENGRAGLNVFTDIDAPAMERIFWTLLDTGNTR